MQIKLNARTYKSSKSFGGVHYGSWVKQTGATLQSGGKEYECVKLFMWEITRELNGTEQGTKSAFKIETREHAENLSI